MGRVRKRRFMRHKKGKEKRQIIPSEGVFLQRMASKMT